MPGLDCNFRIEEVQECDSLIDAFESDDADNDSLNDDISLEVSTSDIIIDSYIRSNP